MRPLRPLPLRRAFAVFFLLTFSLQLFFPAVSYALTTGPHQPEYTSYEEAASTDMVNLATGDFTFNLPVLDVPGPEGGYAVPLSYHAGIGLDQQASWLGLGWNMNVGSLTRSVNQFPDDALDEYHSVTMQDLTGVRGWQSSVLGLGVMGWNTSVGHFGSISLAGIVGYSWEESGSSVMVMGMSVGHRVDFDPVQFGLALVTIISWGAAAGAAQGAGAAATQAAGTTAASAAAAQTVSTAAVIAKQVAIDIAIGAAISSFSSAPTPSAPTAGYWRYSKKSKQKLFYKEYKIWLDQTRKEKMFGTLHLGKIDYNNYSNADSFVDLNVNVNNVSQSSIKEFKKITATTGVASDANYEVDGDYDQLNNPSFLATDDYTVNGPGIAGSITPYRLDVGSVSVPREMSYRHNRLAPVPYEDYKVPFIYKNSLSNTYYHHVGATSNVTSPTFYSGISYTPGNPDPTLATTLTYNLNDVVFGNTQRVRPDLNPIATANRNIFPQREHVEWLSHEEIKNATTYPNSKFIDFLSNAGGASSDRSVFRSTYGFGSFEVAAISGFFNSTIQLDPAVMSQVAVNDVIDLDMVFFDSAHHALPQIGKIKSTKNFEDVTITGVNTSNNTITINDSRLTSYHGKYADIYVTIRRPPAKQSKAIGGFCITASSGITYHYALPVYDYEMRTEIIDPTDDNKKSIIRRVPPYANTWLLTAVTGPDYIDRNSDGLAGPEDWGYWVKFNYGKHLDDYRWRTPYSGTRPTRGNTSKVFATGKNQLIYLNSIETRSHVALFLKSNRLDGRSPSGQQPLKLDEIVLMKREFYNTLISGYGVPNYSNQLNALCMSTSFSAATKNVVNSNALKRVVFGYEYQLCKLTPNSTGDNQAKLTLTRVSMLGRNSKKIVPDYKFEYSNNPDYNSNRWDGWGFYTTSGLHWVSGLDEDGAAWSLTKITSPLGATMTINYERDTYIKISGHAVPGPKTAFTHSQMVTGIEGIYCFNVLSTEGLQVGDYISFDGGTKTYTCPGSPQVTVPLNTAYPSLPIQAINGNQICFGLPYTGSDCNMPNNSYMIAISGEFHKTEASRAGGDIRVASILMQDPGGLQKGIRYEYEREDGMTSGAIAKEPEYAKMEDHDFYDLPYYPFTPVLYSRVSVFSGTMQLPAPLNATHAVKTVYEFGTPDLGLVDYTTASITPSQQLVGDRLTVNGLRYKDYLSIKEHQIKDYSSRIGTLKSVKVYDGVNKLVSSTELQYTGIGSSAADQPANDNNVPYQGVYTQGTLMMERVAGPSNANYHKVSRTTIIDYPYTIKKVIASKDGFSTETENLKWDLISGNVTQTLNKSALGVYTKSVTKPAYQVYPALGSKAADPNNKNMVNAEAASYLYKSNSIGAHLGLISASAKTWKQDGNSYREYNTTNQSYYDGQDPVSASNPLWRVSSSYTWKGDITSLQPDGAFTFTAPADEFNFTGSNPKWQYLGESTRFDHYSMPLESKDINNIFSATKMGYDEQNILASASNAAYKEIAYSGAEDKISDKPYFGGEVALGSGTVVASPVHTGSAALSMSSGYGFVFKSTVLSNKTYRASVWANSQNGRIYYKINNGAEVSPTPVISQAVVINGVSWYRIDLPVPVGNVSSPSVEVGVKSGSGTVIFDDFRFQPSDAAMSCFVYDKNTGQLSHVLDNDNLFTAYEYDDGGVVIRTKRESITYGVKLIMESNQDFKRFHTDQ